MTIAGTQSHEQFFYLRISGLPYYIFATIDPSSSRYGSFAWSAPTDYPATWAQRGLQLPDDEIEQKLPDLIGGLASPARMRLSVIDFQDPSHIGFGFFSRLFAPGRAVSDTSVQKADLDEAVTTGSTELVVRGKSATFVDNTDVYLGAETIGIGDATGPDSNGVSTLPIEARNKYVCYGNSSDDPDTAFPPTPFHRLSVDATGQPFIPPQVTSAVVEVMGRTAALWIGLMDDAGNPQAESQSKCLLLGRIVGLEVGKEGGAFDVTLESITADLQKSLIAPSLAFDNLAGGFIYINGDGWNSFEIYVHPVNTIAGADFHSAIITIPEDTYTVDSICTAVNQALAAGAQAMIDEGMDGSQEELVRSIQLRHVVSPDDGEDRFEFTTSNFRRIHGVGDASLLYALGFTPETTSLAAEQGGTTEVRAAAPMPSFFCPLLSDGVGTAVTLANQTADQFVFDETTSSLRLGNGALVAIIQANVVANTINIGGRTNVNDPNHYYVPIGQIASVQQVFGYGNSIGFPDMFPINLVMGRLLASTTAVATDDVLNVYPEGIGLGWLSIMEEDDWSIEEESQSKRYFMVDRSTKWIDLFSPILREYGLIIVWDPDDGKVRLRRVSIPQPSNASAFEFNESNRASPNDRTMQKIDKTSLRTSWELKFGWDEHEQKFMQVPVVMIDAASRSRYPNDARQESIEDKTLASVELGAGVAGYITARMPFMGVSWTLVQRTVNKTGMLLSPGTIHKIIDATAVNPFTGASEITSSDAVYGVITTVKTNPGSGEVSVELMVNSADDQSLYRPWSPIGLIDFDKNDDDYEHGYNESAKSLRMVSHYGQGNDAADFIATDKIRITVRDMPDGGPPYEYTAVVASVTATDIILTATLAGPLSTDTDSVVMLQSYSDQIALRKAGANKVSFQGNGTTRIIDADTTARLHHWS